MRAECVFALLVLPGLQGRHFSVESDAEAESMPRLLGAMARFLVRVGVVDRRLQGRFCPTPHVPLRL